LLSARRSVLITDLAQMACVEIVKSGDALGRQLPHDAVDRFPRLPRPPDAAVCDPLDLVVSGHLVRVFPSAAEDMPCLPALLGACVLCHGRSGIAVLRLDQHDLVAVAISDDGPCKQATSACPPGPEYPQRDSNPRYRRERPAS
jgi:hypothetical protein